MSKDYKENIAKANTQLKCLGVTLEEKANRLAVRGTFPPKPGSDRTKPYQQRIYLNCRINPGGIKKAEVEAKKIGALLSAKDFDWEPYLSDRNKPQELLVKDWVEKFKERFFPTSKTKSISWEKDYQVPYRKLPQERPLTLELLEQTLISLKLKTDSRSQQRYSLAYKRLARLAGLEYAPDSGDYSSSKAVPREIPEDEQIVECYKKILNPDWRWIFGMLAVYGLRNHEVFYVDPETLMDEDSMIKVLDGKTGSRYVTPLHPEWVDQFKLRERVMPDINGETNSAKGARITQYFKRSGIPFTPYSLRHGWAIRSMKYNLDLTIAARMMGHSLAVHSKVYHHWISERTLREEHKKAIQNPNRPKPPYIDEEEKSG